MKLYNDIFVCKSISLANFLISNGLNIKKVDIDNVSNNYVVFLFEKNKLFEKIMNEWNKR